LKAVTVTNLENFVVGLARAYSEYRDGVDKDDVPTQRKGALSALEALIKLGELVLEEAGASAADQAKIFGPIRGLHAAVGDLNERIQHPRLLRPMPVDSRAPTVEMPEIAVHGDAAAAMRLLMRSHVRKDKAAVSVSIKLGNGVSASSVKQWYRDAIEGRDEHRRLTERFEMMLQLAEEYSPGEPAKAAEEVIRSIKKMMLVP
jgi:hypothetical protein